jgi:hypothetical protein
MTILCSRERKSTCWENHEFLHGEFVTSMTASINDIECWDRKNDFFVSSKISNVAVEWNSLLVKIINSINFVLIEIIDSLWIKIIMSYSVTVLEVEAKSVSFI